MGIFSAIGAWIIGLFSKEKIGILFFILFKAGASAIAEQLTNQAMQKKALEFVQELAKRNDLTNAEKAKLFNEKMVLFASSLGRTICESVINCLRELAVVALKTEKGR